MTCEQFQERLTAFSLGELEAMEADAARDHVAHCSACASRALLDRQLTALLRASAVPMPAAGRARVMAALRAEAARESGRRGRLRHWVALGAAAGLAAVLLAAVVLVVPAPERSSPLTAAWEAYRAEPVMASYNLSSQGRLTAVLGSSANTPDLSGFGLDVRASGARMLAGHLAAVTEYRDASSRRVTLIRWRGKLPVVAGGKRPAPAGPDSRIEAARWGPIGSTWWQDRGIVYCLIGAVEQRTLFEVTDHLHDAEAW